MANYVNTVVDNGSNRYEIHATNGSVDEASFKENLFSTIGGQQIINNNLSTPNNIENVEFVNIGGVGDETNELILYRGDNDLGGTYSGIRITSEGVGLFDNLTLVLFNNISENTNSLVNSFQNTGASLSTNTLYLVGAASQGTSLKTFSSNEIKIKDDLLVAPRVQTGTIESQGPISIQSDDQSDTSRVYIDGLEIVFLVKTNYSLTISNSEPEQPRIGDVWIQLGTQS